VLFGAHAIGMIACAGVRHYSSIGSERRARAPQSGLPALALELDKYP
jgi:hypothetical protein